MRKPAFCICENKDADQLCGNHEADQRLCFVTGIVQSLYFLNPKFQASSHLLWLYSPICVGPVGNPEDRFFSQQGSILIVFSTEKSPSPGYKFLQLIGAQKLPGNERITVRQLSDALVESNQVLANDIMLGKIGKVCQNEHRQSVIRSLH